MIKISGITKYYGKNKILKNLDLEVGKDEILTIIGPSGCGKTTLLNIIAGLISCEEGSIEINKKKILDENVFIKPENRNISMVFQSYALWPMMNIFDNVAYPLKVRKVKKGIIEEKVKNILELVHLSGKEYYYPGELSGGEKQRVALARALIYEPELLLLDEPLSNLDANLRDDMQKEIRYLSKKLKLTVIHVTHDQKEAMAMSDKIAVMCEGEILEVNTPLNLYKNPENEFTKEFFGKTNIVSGKRINNIITLENDIKINSPGKDGEVQVSLQWGYIR